MQKTELDLIWVLFSAVLVLLMQGGFLCLESGLTRQKNAINVALKNMTDFVVTCLIWWALGFGLMFGHSYMGWLGHSSFFTQFEGAGAWLGIFFIFQMVFCATAATIISGAVAERMRFSAYILVTIVAVAFIYPVYGHWVWGGAFTGDTTWLADFGFVDFAGSTVVHSLGGWVALAAVLIVGPRLGRFNGPEGRSIPASNIAIAMFGSLLLVIGWIGFNGGSTLGFTDQVPAIIVHTMLAAVSGGLASYWLSQSANHKHIEAAIAPMNGLIAGLVAITAGCHAVSAFESVVIGFVGGTIFMYGNKLLVSLKIDDVISAVPVHLFAGIWGTLAVALFGDPQILGTGLTMAQQLVAQIVGIVVCAAWAFPTSFVAFYALNKVCAFRVSAEDEQVGLNVAEHDAHTDLIDLMNSMRSQKESCDISLRLPVEPFTEVGQIAARHNEIMDSLERTVVQNDAIVNEITAGILTLGKDGEIFSINPAAAKIFQQSANGVLGKNLLDLIEIQAIKDLNTGHAIPNKNADDVFSAECNVEVIGNNWAGEEKYLEIRISASKLADFDFNCLIRDNTSRRLIEESLFTEQERTQVTLDSIADGVITTDADGCVIYMNGVSETLTGWAMNDALGEKLHRIFPVVETLQDMPSDTLVDFVLKEKKSVSQSGNKILYCKDGNTHAIRHTAAPIFDSHGKVMGMVVVFQDVTNDRAMERKLSYQATHDGLTGLINRTEFENRLSELMKESQEKGTEHVIFFLDLDQFKLVNDVCGHSAGDELLKQLARQLKELLRGTDTLARLGGDEFGVLLPGCDLDKGLIVAEKMREVVKDFRFPWDGKQFAVGASIGVTSVTNNSNSLAELLSLADAACYAAKDAGRNRVHVYEQDDIERLDRHKQMKWVSRIRNAIDEDRLRLYFQPIVPVDSPDHKASHFEVLIRLINEEGEDVPPGAFIPAAERYNLMAEIDQWVIKHTLEWLSKNRDQLQGLTKCAINLSGESISHKNFLELVIQQFETYQVEPKLICFEITETVAISNLQTASEFITQLKEIGCQFALDDFGSGLSSFGYLRNLPVDYLKIDGAFIKDIDNNEVDQAMVQSIHSIGHTMGLKAIAEFVESQDILDILKDIGVDYAQGYYIDKPKPLTEYFGEADDLDMMSKAV